MKELTVRGKTNGIIVRTSEYWQIMLWVGTKPEYMDHIRYGLWFLPLRDT